jgi:glycosyl hydrolase family 99
MAVRVHEARKLEIARHAREDTRVLRRLLVVGLAWASLCAPAFARAGTVSVFYYPWYGTPSADGAWQHWDQNGHRPPADVYSRFFPALGAYSSSNPAVVDRQMSEIAAAGVDEVVVSWWGRGSAEDGRLPLVLTAARRHGLLAAIHLEPYEGRSAATVPLDLGYLASLGIRDVYVYHPRDLAVTAWVELRAQVPPGMRLFGGTEKAGFAAAARFDGLYTYDFLNWNGGMFGRLCAQARAVHLLCAPSVGPGYDGRRAGEPPVGRPRRDGATYDALWTAALAANPDVVSITSFNEWGEGTQIEPAQARGRYHGYDGAWGLTGTAAQSAYLARTAYWAGRFHSVR